MNHDYKYLRDTPDDDKPTLWQELCLGIVCALCLSPFVYSLLVQVGVIA